jgi:hypothetical protein
MGSENTITVNHIWNPPFPKIKSKKEGGYQAASQCSPNIQSDPTNYFKHY